jgi:hypothetical protein
MGAGELADRVVRTGAVAAVACAVLAGMLVGPWEGAGVLAGGVIAFGNFRWLARDAGRLGTIGEAGAGRRRLPGGLRQIAAFAALAALIGSGVSHPLAVAVGLALLPPVLVVQGLRGAAR